MVSFEIGGDERVSRLRQMISIHNLTYMVIGLVSFMLLAIYWRQKKNEGKEIKRLKAFIAFLEHVFYQYTISQCVEEAILKSLEFVDIEIQEMAEKFYDLLMLEDIEELRNVKREYSCSYYYQFAMYSYLAMEYGDVSEKAIYLDNITFLKKQIFIWVLNREKLEHNLAGLMLVILTPVVCLKAIEVWAQGNLEELSRYYQGMYGVVTRFVMVFVTIFCYQIIWILRQNYDVHFFSSNLLTRVAENHIIIVVYEWWTEHHPKEVRRFTLLLRKSSSRVSLKEFLVLRLGAFVLVGVLSFVILVPIAKVTRTYVVLLIAAIFLMGIIASYMPVWFLEVRLQLMNRQKEGEAYFYYGVSRMVALGGNGDVYEILNWLELGGEIFVPTIQVCMDEFSYDNEEALENGKRLEPFVPFVKLLDAFKISEVIGLEQALDPLMLELDNHIEKRKQDNEISTANKGVFGRFVAFVPIVCVIGLYLIVPFVLESLVQLQEYVKQIQAGL